MTRPPKLRRTSSSRKPVTIDLEANDIEADPSADHNDRKSTDDPDRNTQEDASSAVLKDNEGKNSSAAEETKPELTENKNLERKSGSSFLGGLLGGVLVLGGAAGLQWMGILPALDADGPEGDIQQVDITPFQAEIDALKREITTLEQGRNDSEATVPDAVIERLNTIDGNAQTALDAATSAESKGAELVAKVNDLQSALSSGNAGESAGLEAMALRLEEYETQLSDLVSRLNVGRAPVSNDMAAKVEEMTRSLNTLQKELDEQVDHSLRQEEMILEQLTDIKARIAENEKIISESESNNNVANAIATAGLKSAIDRGGPFMGELEAFATVARNKSIVDALRKFAASGVPTVSQLSDQFPAIANKIVATGQGLDANAGIADRLMASARSLIQVRPVGNVEGDSPGDIAARIEVYLKRGDLDAALAQWDMLPEAAKSVSSDFHENLMARRSVNAMVGEALGGAISATTSITSE